MRRVELRVERLAVRTEAEVRDGGALDPVLRRAMALLGERLARLPGSRWEGAADLALEEVTVDDLTWEQLVSPRGAERLADALFDRVVRGQ